MRLSFYLNSDLVPLSVAGPLTSPFSAYPSLPSSHQATSGGHTIFFPRSDLPSPSNSDSHSLTVHHGSHILLPDAVVNMIVKAMCSDRNGSFFRLADDVFYRRPNTEDPEGDDDYFHYFGLLLMASKAPTDEVKGLNVQLDLVPTLRRSAPLAFDLSETLTARFMSGHFLVNAEDAEEIVGPFAYTPSHTDSRATHIVDQRDVSVRFFCRWYPLVDLESGTIAAGKNNDATTSRAARHLEYLRDILAPTGAHVLLCPVEEIPAWCIVSYPTAVESTAELEPTAAQSSQPTEPISVVAKFVVPSVLLMSQDTLAKGSRIPPSFRAACGSVLEQFRDELASQCAAVYPTNLQVTVEEYQEPPSSCPTWSDATMTDLFAVGSAIHVSAGAAPPEEIVREPSSGATKTPTPIPPKKQPPASPPTPPASTAKAPKKAPKSKGKTKAKAAGAAAPSTPRPAKRKKK